MSLSPIATLVRLSPSFATLSLAAEQPEYDPDAEEDQVGAAPTTAEMRGVYSKASIAGIEVKHKAIFLVAATAEPEGLVPDVTGCLAGGINYIVREVENRWYLGAYDGFTLHLGL